MKKAGGGQRCPQCKAAICDSAEACARAAQAACRQNEDFAAEVGRRDATARLLRGELLRGRLAPAPEFARGAWLAGRLWRRLPRTAEGDA